jgi:actin-related protein 10
MAGAAPPVLLDVGSAFVRVGFVGEAQPRSVIPSPIGKHLRRPPQQTLRQWQWESILSPFLASLYIDVLHCKPWERNVFLCETLVGCRPLRQAIAEILFSYLSVPSIGILSGPLPSLYCTGSLSGLILDIGQRESHVLAVWRGVPIQASYVGEL